MPRPTRLIAVIAGLACAAALALAGGAAQASGFHPGPVGSDEFKGGQVYRGDFPDPTILRVGDTWYAYATTVANKNLPVLTSTDLVTWTAHAPWRKGEWWNNDALGTTAAWAESRRIGERRVSPTWAPSVAQVGSRFVHAYATPLRGSSPRKFCISVSTATNPLGPFTDSTVKPLECPPKQGAIDPQVWVAPNHTRWLLFKTEGRRGIESTKLWSRRLDVTATKFYPNTRRNELLSVQPGWEGSVIENPAMIKYAGHYYLFYSGNYWASSRYAVGYAMCTNARRGCTRPSRTPLLATDKVVSGPGGATPFVGPDGKLRIVYHAWKPGQVGYPSSSRCQGTKAGCAQRRLHIATLTVDPKTGRLSVATRG